VERKKGEPVERMCKSEGTKQGQPPSTQHAEREIVLKKWQMRPTLSELLPEQKHNPQKSETITQGK
jgi:hypothetical protein